MFKASFSMPAFPSYRQLEKADCGPTCLRIISRYYGRNHSIEYLRERSYTTKSGASLLGLGDAAESIGFQTQGAFISWEQLRDEVPLPAIVHWNKTHFVVVYKIKTNRSAFSFKNSHKEKIFVSDPSYGLLKYTKDQFIKQWCNGSNGRMEGAVLLLETTPAFYSHNSGHQTKQNLALRSLFQFLLPYKKYLFQLFLGLLTGTLINLAFPFLTQAIVDQGINTGNLSFIIIVLIAQIVLTFGQTANNLIQSWISLHVTSRVSIKLISGFLAKLMRLPISFFYARTIGDIMQRITDQNRIQSFITDTVISTAFSFITLLAYSLVMFQYNLQILAVFYIGSFLYVGWISIFLRIRSELDYKRFRESTNNQNSIVELVTGMQEIRIAGCERQKRWEWERIQAKLFKVSLKGLMLTQNQTLGSTFIDQIKNVSISFLAAKAVIDGQMTLGAMVAVQYMIGQLNAPIQKFLGFIQSGQDAKISIDRLNTVYEKSDEESPEENKISDIPKDGSINVKNLSFQFDASGSEKILNRLTFEIPPNRVTAIVGASGSGKTTLLKLLLRIYRPVEGEISLGNISIDSYSPSSWRRNCAVVMQDGYIFSDTIMNNICLSPADLDRERLDRAVSAANIKEFIETLPLGYHTKIGTNGHGLSSGQKQRLLIARAMYKQCNFIFFDEATNALDSQNENKIIDNLEEIFYNKTAIIIAHRLSTIKRAHQILVLDKGIIVESGTHDQLIQWRGFYFNLIQSQLE